MDRIDDTTAHRRVPRRRPTKHSVVPDAGTLCSIGELVARGVTGPYLRPMSACLQRDVHRVTCTLLRLCRRRSRPPLGGKTFLLWTSCSRLLNGRACPTTTRLQNVGSRRLSRSMSAASLANDAVALESGAPLSRVVRRDPPIVQADDELGEEPDIHIA